MIIENSISSKTDITQILNQYLDGQVSLDIFFFSIKQIVFIVYKDNQDRTKAIFGQDPNFNIDEKSLMFFTNISSRNMKPEYVLAQIPLYQIKKILTYYRPQ